MAEVKKLDKTPEIEHLLKFIEGSERGWYR